MFKTVATETPDAETFLLTVQSAYKTVTYTYMSITSKHIEQCWPHRGRETGMVAFVNKTKLDHMNILCETSRHLVDKIGAKRSNPREPHGVHYATNKHWMVHGWIPIQCIDRLISLEDFQHVCSQIPGASASKSSMIFRPSNCFSLINI